MATITIQRCIGYSGNNSQKQWLAEVLGTCPTYGYRREFIQTSTDDVAGMLKVKRKRKGTWTETADVGPGLYESQDYGCGHRYMYVTDAGDVVRLTEARFAAMARLMTERSDEDNQYTAAEAYAATEPTAAE